jgi:hypothetical protein
MAYPAYASDGGIVNAYQNASINAAYPSTVNAGDFLLLFITKDMSSLNNAVSVHPTGFSSGPIRVSSKKGSAWMTTVVYYKRATGTESGTVNMQWVATPYTYNSAIMYRYTGVVGGGYPFDDTDGGQSVAASSTYTQYGCTTVGSERILMGYTILYSSSTANTATGWTSRDTINSAGYYHKMQDRQVATAQTVSDVTGSITGTASHWISFSFALKPGTGWPHKYMGVDNFDMKEIMSVDLSEIAEVNETA